MKDNRCVTVGVAIPLNILRRLDHLRGATPRSRLIVNLVRLHVEDAESRLHPEGEPSTKQEEFSVECS